MRQPRSRAQRLAKPWIPAAAPLLLSLFPACAALPKVDGDLFAAVQRDDASEAARLAASGANINAKGDREHDGLTPLAWAGVWGSTRTAELLLARGADVKWANGDGVTALHVAAYNLQPAVARLLIQKGAKVDARTFSGAWTPLYKTVVRLGMPPRPGTPREASVAKAIETAGVLLGSGADVNARDVQSNTPIHFAVVTREKALVQFLIDKGADVNARNADEVDPLFVAAGGDLVDIAELLIGRGADPNVGRWDLKPLEAAAMVGDKALAEAALAHGAMVDPPPAPGTESPLLAAIGEAHADVAKMLINKGADVNARTARLQRNSLHALAAHMPDPRIAELLLRHGADVNAKDLDGRTALAVAVKEGHTEVADVLRRHGGR